jgi:hypothetical protein
MRAARRGSKKISYSFSVMTDVLLRGLRERPLSGSGLGTSNDDYEGALLPDRFALRKRQISAEVAVKSQQRSD